VAETKTARSVDAAGVSWLYDELPKCLFSKSGDGIVQNLKDSELRYRRLFESAQDGILILDAKTGMIEDVNPYLIKMLAYSREEFVKKNFGKSAHSEISTLARKPLKHYRRMSSSVTMTCRSRQRMGA